MDQIYLSIVIPCYNEAEGLPELCRRVTAACANLGKPYEVVLINDGSRDATWQKMMEATQADPRIIGVNLSRNHGHQLALSAGLTLCRGERILILDADLQDPPELMTDMMALMDQGADVVYGQRRTRAGETAFKKITASLFYRIIERLTDVPIPRETGDFRMMSRRALDVLISMPERHRFIRGMVSWIGFRQVPLMYDRAARFAGETKYPLRKMIRFAIDAVTSFSVKPLAVASYVGMISGIFALGLLVFAGISYLFFRNSGLLSPGWTSLMAAISLLGSVQLMVLGIFGEYLGRLYEQSKGRPLFIIQQVVQSPQAQADNGTSSTHEPAHAPVAKFAAAGQKVEV